MAEEWPLLVGQRFDTNLQVALPYTEQTKSITAAAALAGQPNVEIIPKDKLRSLVRVEQPPTAVIEGFLRSFPVETRIDLPDVLVGLMFRVSRGVGKGVGKETGSGASGGTGSSINQSITNSSDASASLQPELTPIIASRPQPEQEATDYFFYMAANSTHAQVRARLGQLLTSTGSTVTINPWPRFTPRAHIFSLFGSRASVRASASARLSYSQGEGSAAQSTSAGTSYSENFDETVRAVFIRETIHEAIDLFPDDNGTLSVASLTGGTTATASAELQFESLHPQANVSRSLYAQSAVFPSSIPATGTLTAIPTTGLYAQQIDVGSKSEFAGYYPVRVRVFDFDTLPPVTYEFGDIAGNAGGTSSAAPTVVPEPPAGLYAYPSSTSGGTPYQYIILGWNDTAPGIRSFQPQRATSVNGPWMDLNQPLDPTDQSYHDADVSSGQTYFYRVVATNVVGTSAPSVPVKCSLAAGDTNSSLDPATGNATDTNFPTVIPDPPVGITVGRDYSNGQALAYLKVTWQSPATHLRSFRVERSTTDTVDASFSQIGLLVDPVRRAFYDLVPASNAFYRVIATNVVGDSAPSVIRYATYP